MSFNNKINRLSLLMMLTTSLTAFADVPINKSNIKPLQKSNTSVLMDSPSTFCPIDDNGQNWSKLQRQLKNQLADKSSKKSSSRSLRRTALEANTIGNGIAGRYYIPVVFHIYGEQFNCDDSSKKCLTDEKIVDALQRLNEDFQGTNTQDGPIAEQFQSIRENLNIEFVLAKKTPDGQVTTGIIHYDREQAGYGNGSGADDLIAADAWDNFSYMNVYVMNDLYDDDSTNNSGVAWYPELSMSQANTSRVVYNGLYVGDNTSENFRSVLTHEFGHWLNLPHTFAGNSCSLANETFCGLTGDGSCDTPQMSLSTDMYENSLNCLGQPTNTENFMHYTSNYAMFTQDQVARMTAALHGDARSTLWSNANLIDAGLTELTSNSTHDWDGVSGIDNGPSGDVIASFDALSADKDDIDTFVIDAPTDTQALAFYLSGYTQDPDMYVSLGEAPTLLGDGNWQADYISFLSTGTPEFIGILGPKTDQSYHAAVHAFTAYDQGKLEVFAVEDPLLTPGTKRYHVLEQKGLLSPKGIAPKQFKFTIPDEAEKVVIVFAGAYDGDPDMYVSRNKPVTIDDADCAPFSASKLAEYCEFSQGCKLASIWHFSIGD